eukprot:scaffold3571_cov176-Amphora_coffeaeformis.AAC.21
MRCNEGNLPWKSDFVVVAFVERREHWRSHEPMSVTNVSVLPSSSFTVCQIAPDARCAHPEECFNDGRRTDHHLSDHASHVSTLTSWRDSSWALTVNPTLLFCALSKKKRMRWWTDPS